MTRRIQFILHFNYFSYPKANQSWSDQITTTFREVWVGSLWNYGYVPLWFAISRHAAVSDLIKRSLAAAKISGCFKPVEICQGDGKQPDHASVMPWRSGQVLVWDATYLSGHLCPRPSHLQLAAREVGVYSCRPGWMEEKGHIH